MKQTLVKVAMIVGSALLFSIPAMAQFIPGKVVTIDVRDALAHPWKHVGHVDASDYSYQVSHAIKYDGRSAPSQTINVDVLMRESVRGSNGKITEATLSYIEVMCYPDHTFPSKFVLHGSKTFDTDGNGLPGAPVDDYFRFYANDGQVVTVQQGSPGAVLQQAVCGDKSLYAHIPPVSKHALIATLDGAVVDPRAVIVEGRTNLPDGTLLFVEFHRGNWYASNAAQVQGRTYRSPALSKPGGQSLHGDYNLVVRTAPAQLQTFEVVSVIGKDGANLQGDLAHEGEVRYEAPVALP